MKMGFKENIRFAFIDEFANEIGKEKAYRMMSNFKCERVPALEYYCRIFYIDYYMYDT